MAATRKTEKYSTLSSAYRFEPIAVENLGVFQGRPRDFFQGVIGGGMGQWSGGTMASAEYEPITGVWGQSPQRGPGAEPLVRGSGGRSPLKLKAFWSLDVQRSRQI